MLATIRQRSGWVNPTALPALTRSYAEAAFSHTSLEPQYNDRTTAAKIVQHIPLRTGRPRLVVLGSGWAAARLLRDIDPKLYDLSVISKRNHMIMTPLLASTAVGTLESRSVAVHLTDIQKAIFSPQNNLFISKATRVDPARKVVECVSEDGLKFAVEYDKLAICTGSQGSTFGIPGVQENVHFLRQICHAQAIRSHLMENMAKAGIPGRPLPEVQRLLHVVIVGGGPTGVEVAGELTDFIKQDLAKLYPNKAQMMRITLIEAREVLGSFNSSLREYTARKLVKRGVILKQGVVKQVTPEEITLTDGTVIPYGMCIWSTGVGPTRFISSLPFAKTNVGRLAVDKYMRVLAPSGPDPAVGEGPGAHGVAKVSLLTDETSTPSIRSLEPVPGVYALGDCCANPDKPLPALAQVAEQQGRYLAKVLNEEAKERAAAKNKPAGATPALITPKEEFVYKTLGSMASVGGNNAVLELTGPRNANLSWAGFLSWLAWRSAYLTRLGSWQKRCAVAFQWASVIVFGRDMSRW